MRLVSSSGFALFLEKQKHLRPMPTLKAQEIVQERDKWASPEKNQNPINQAFTGLHIY